jgi:hypothetical protein
VRVWALLELGDAEAIDIYVREEDAVRAVEDALGTSLVGPAR